VKSLSDVLDPYFRLDALNVRLVEQLVLIDLMKCISSDSFKQPLSNVSVINFEFSISFNNLCSYYFGLVYPLFELIWLILGNLFR